MAVTSDFIYYLSGGTAIDLRYVATAYQDEYAPGTGYAVMKKTQEDRIFIPDWDDFLDKWKNVIQPSIPGYSRFIANGEPFKVFNGVDHDQYQVVEP